MTDQLERQTDTLAALLVAGEFRAAERAIDGLRELAWRRRAVEIRAWRHAGPGTRGAINAVCEPYAVGALTAIGLPASVAMVSSRRAACS